LILCSCFFPLSFFRNVLVVFRNGVGKRQLVILRLGPELLVDFHLLQQTFALKAARTFFCLLSLFFFFFPQDPTRYSRSGRSPPFLSPPRDAVRISLPDRKRMSLAFRRIPTLHAWAVGFCEPFGILVLRTAASI